MLYEKKTEYERRRFFGIATELVICSSALLARRRLFQLGLFNADPAIGYILAVECFHRRLGITLLGHLNEAKTLRAAGRFVDYQCAGLHSAVGFEHYPELCLRYGAGKIAYQ